MDYTILRCLVICSLIVQTHICLVASIIPKSTFMVVSNMSSHDSYFLGSHHVLDEAERSLHDALCVLSQTVNDSRVLLGGGWPEMIMAKEVDELAKKTPGKKSHAIEAFSKALLAIPTIIADNAGLDSAELIAQLRAEHHKEGCNVGIDVITGSVSY